VDGVAGKAPDVFDAEAYNATRAEESLAGSWLKTLSRPQIEEAPPPDQQTTLRYQPANTLARARGRSRSAAYCSRSVLSSYRECMSLPLARHDASSFEQASLRANKSTAHSRTKEPARAFPARAASGNLFRDCAHVKRDRARARKNFAL